VSGNFKFSEGVGDTRYVSVGVFLDPPRHGARNRFQEQRNGVAHCSSKGILKVGINIHLQHASPYSKLVPQRNGVYSLLSLFFFISLPPPLPTAVLSGGRKLPFFFFINNCLKGLGHEIEFKHFDKNG
jgi:hypothetical protein